MTEWLSAAHADDWPADGPDAGRLAWRRRVARSAMVLFMALVGLVIALLISTGRSRTGSFVATVLALGAFAAVWGLTGAGPSSNGKFERLRWGVRGMVVAATASCAVSAPVPMTLLLVMALVVLLFAFLSEVYVHHGAPGYARLASLCSSTLVAIIVVTAVAKSVLPDGATDLTGFLIPIPFASLGISLVLLLRLTHWYRPTLTWLRHPGSKQWAYVAAFGDGVVEVATAHEVRSFGGRRAANSWLRDDGWDPGNTQTDVAPQPQSTHRLPAAGASSVARVVERRHPHLMNLATTIAAFVPVVIGMKVHHAYGMAATVTFGAVVLVGAAGGAFVVYAIRERKRRIRLLRMPLTPLSALSSGNRVRVCGALSAARPVEVPLAGVPALSYRGEAFVEVAGSEGQHGCRAVAAVFTEAADCRIRDGTAIVDVDLSSGVEGLGPGDLEVYVSGPLKGDPLGMGSSDYTVRIEYLPVDLQLTLAGHCSGRPGKWRLAGAGQPVIVSRTVA